VQNVQPSSSVECERFVVKAHVPALGWTVCRLKRRGPHARPRLPKGPAITAKTDTLDNGLLRVRVTTGGVHLRDLERARALTRTPGIRVLVIDDPSDTWGHDCYRFDRVKGSFALTSVRCIERGPLRAALRAEYRYRKSRLYLDILVEQGRKACELRARLLLLEKRVLVKVAVPVNARSKSAWHEIPYGAIERTNSGEEMPVQQWLDLSDGTLGLSLVNNGRYAASVERNEMRQTIARSAPYAWQDYRACRREAGAAWTDDRWFHDQGFSECALLLIPHEGDWRKACTVREARKFNRALSIVQEGMHGGGLAPCFGFIRCSSRDVLVSVVKRSEDGAGFVVRASEIAGRRCRARFSIPALRAGWQSAFGPWEIKTFRFAAERPGNVKEIDLTETGGG